MFRKELQASKDVLNFFKIFGRLVSVIGRFLIHGSFLIRVISNNIIALANPNVNKGVASKLT